MTDVRVIDDTGTGKESPIRVPRPALWAAAALIITAMLLGGIGSMAGLGRPQPMEGTPVVERHLRFTDEADGSVAVWEASTIVHRVARGEENFIRGSMRSMASSRAQLGLGNEAPFTLAQWPDGRLTLDDPQTGVRIELNAFGQTNRAAYARLLE